MGSKVRVNWGGLPEGRSVSMHVIWNSAFQRLYVLAENEKTALQIANVANHIHYMDGGFSKDVACFKGRLESFPGYTDARVELDIAVARRLQGTLHLDGGKLAIGDEVIVAER
jgi:hypothetical protein